MEQVRLGLMYLGWEENLAEDEIPPKRIWTDGDRLGEWFADVKRARAEKYGLDDDKGDWVENDLVDELVVG